MTNFECRACHSTEIPFRIAERYTPPTEVCRDCGAVHWS